MKRGAGKSRILSLCRSRLIKHPPSTDTETVYRQLPFMKMSLEKIARKGQRRAPFALPRESGAFAVYKSAQTWSTVVGILAIRACTAGPTTPRHYVTSMRHKTRAPTHTSLILTRTRASERASERVCRNERALIIVPLNLEH